MTYNVFSGTLNPTQSLTLRPTRHKIGHFGDILPSQPLGIVRKKINLTHNSKIVKLNQKKTKC